MKKLVLGLVSIILLVNLIACANEDWRTASRESAGISASPDTELEPK